MKSTVKKLETISTQSGPIQAVLPRAVSEPDFSDTSDTAYGFDCSTKPDPVDKFYGLASLCRVLGVDPPSSQFELFGDILDSHKDILESVQAEEPFRWPDNSSRWNEPLKGSNPVTLSPVGLGELLGASKGFENVCYFGQIEKESGLPQGLGICFGKKGTDREGFRVLGEWNGEKDILEPEEGVWRRCHRILRPENGLFVDDWDRASNHQKLHAEGEVEHISNEYREPSVKSYDSDIPVEPGNPYIDDDEIGGPVPMEDDNALSPDSIE